MEMSPHETDRLAETSSGEDGLRETTSNPRAGSVAEPHYAVGDLQDCAPKLPPPSSGFPGSASTGPTMTNTPTPGRPPDGPARKERTVQVSLRLPANWVKMLRHRALAAAAVENAIITPQEIVRRIIAQAMNIKP